MDDLVLLPEAEAVQKHLDLKNRGVFDRLLILFGLWAVVSTALAVLHKDMLALAGAAAGLLAVFAVLALRETAWFERYFRYVLIDFFLLQLVLLVLPLGAVEPALGIAGVAVPFLLVTLRLRVSETLILYGVCWGMTAFLIFRRSAAGTPWGSEALVTTGAASAIALALSLATTARERRAFLRDWRRESAHHRERSRLRTEVEYARRIQVGMLPQSNPDLGWLELSAASLPANEVGGDYYDYFPLSPQVLGLVIGDVSGHGLASGILLSGIRSCLYLLDGELADPVASLGRLHRMVQRTTDRRTFVTLLLALLDHEKKTLTVASAGHPPLLLFRAATRELEEVGEGAPPLGTRLAGSYTADCRPVASGDVLVLYTDGLSEMVDPFGREYGYDRLQRTVQKAVGAAAARPRSARQIRDALLEDLASFKGGGEQLDDITLVVVRVS